MFPYFNIGKEIIYTYPLLMGMAWGLSFHLFYYYQQKFKINFPRAKFYLIGVFLFSWLGAKVLFLLSTHNNNESLILSTNFWLGGGFVFYGGLIFGALFTISFFYLNKMQWQSLNIILPTLAFAHAIGRLGCFMAGCCYGKKWDGPFAIHLHGEERFPIQLVEALGLVVIGIILQRSILKKNAILIYLASYSVLRFMLEFFRGDQIRGIYQYNLSTSQFVSIGIWSLLIVYLLLSFRGKHKS